MLDSATIWLFGNRGFGGGRECVFFLSFSVEDG